MKIVAQEIMKNLWQAVDEDTYDGAPDSRTRHQIGIGRTKEQAIADLMEEIEQGIP